MHPRSPAASVTNMTEYVLPTHANVLGNVFGGQILAWVDLCAAICAQRHTGHIIITAGVDELSFEKPIKVGQVVLLSAMQGHTLEEVSGMLGIPIGTVKSRLFFGKKQLAEKLR